MRVTRRRWSALFAAVALATAVAGAPAAAAGGLDDALRKLAKQTAQDGRRLGFAPEAARGEGPLTLDQAVARVRREHPKAEIVSAETRMTDDGAVHVIKVLSASGKIKVYKFEAARRG